MGITLWAKPAPALALAGANTYSGGTTLSAGRLDINHAAALGAGPLTISGASTIGNTSGHAVTVANDSPQAWNADFTFAGTDDLHLGNGAVTLGGNRQVTVTAGTLTIGGAVSGNYSLTKAGAGTLTLSGANTYGGNTNINAGTLRLAGDNRLPPATQVSLANAAGVDARSRWPESDHRQARRRRRQRRQHLSRLGRNPHDRSQSALDFRVHRRH